jgi:hypothetical protein
MMKWIPAALALTLLATPVLADEPWVAYGQTLVPYNTAVDNPPANAAGAIGEVSLPYTVPEGFYLEITSFGVEAYNTAGLVGIFPWIGPKPATNAKALHTVMANDHYEESTGLRYRFPPGAIINIRIMCTENPAQVVGWQVTGRLIAIGALTE